MTSVSFYGYGICIEQGDPSRKIMEIPADGEVEGIPWNPLEWKILGGGVKLEKKTSMGIWIFSKFNSTGNSIERE